MSFNKIRRQKFLSEKDYLEEEEVYDLGVEQANEVLSTGRLNGEPVAPGADSSFRWNLASESLEILLLRYTAGRPIEELHAQLPDVINAFDIYIANEVSPRSEKPPRAEADTLEITQLDAYVYVFWLLALCKLLRHDEFISKVMGWVDKTYTFNRRRDGLFENVVQELTFPSHAEKLRVLLHPVPYRPLARATICQPEERAAYVKEFVESWYKGMKPTYWYGEHTGGVYFGYWCLEAALVTVLWDIDDSSYRDHMVYPKDLVDWYRARQEEAAPKTKKRVLRALPGEPCPRSGEWFSHFLKKTVKMTTGEPMPGPEYDMSNNQVIWYMEIWE